MHAAYSSFTSTPTGRRSPPKLLGTNRWQHHFMISVLHATSVEEVLATSCTYPAAIFSQARLGVSCLHHQVVFVVFSSVLVFQMSHNVSIIVGFISRCSLDFYPCSTELSSLCFVCVLLLAQHLFQSQASIVQLSLTMFRNSSLVCHSKEPCSARGIFCCLGLFIVLY